MNRWKKALMPAMVALTVCMPMSAFAEGSADAGGGGSSVPKQTIASRLDGLQDRLQDRLQHVREGLTASAGPHREMYLELLAEKYAPDTLDSWKAAFAEREETLDQFKALKPALQQRAGDAKDRLEENLQALRDKVKNGEFDSDQAKRQIQQQLKDRQSRLSELLGAVKPDAEARKALEQEFAKAVADQSAAEIQAVLPKLLDQYKQDTAVIASALEQLQAKQQAPAQP